MRTAALLCLLALFASAPFVRAADADPPVLSTKVRTLAAFKNGLGFVFRSGEAELKDGWTVLDELPAASLGTLWIGAAPPARVEQVVSYKGKIGREAESVNLEETLRANAGRRARITYAPSEVVEPREVDGFILSVPRDREADPVNPALARPDSSGRYVPVPVSQIVLIRTNDGETLVIPKGSVRAIKLPKDASLTTRVEREVNSAKIRVVGGTSARTDITLAYLEKGITWSPSYLVNVADEKMAEVTLEAVLANDVEDLEDAEVSFVVGYPNFVFADKLTPLYAQQSVAQFAASLQASASTPGYGGYASVMAQSIANSAAYSVRNEWRPETAYAASSPMPGESNEDLYFYRQPHVTLKKGDRARYTVFTAKVPYEHVYTWTVPDSMNVDYRGYRQSSSGASDPAAEQVWHALRLQNTTKQPWTTAPAFTVNGSMPVAQDIMQYTPPTVSNSLKLTVATDIKADQAQTESARRQVTILGDGYDEVTVDGKLTVKNLKSRPVKMNVRKTLTGQVAEVSKGGKVVRSAKKLAAVNPESEIEWEFDLAASGESELSYTYKILLHR